MVAGERKSVCENAKSGTNAIQHLHSIETSNGDTGNLQRELPLSSCRIYDCISLPDCETE